MHGGRFVSICVILLLFLTGILFAAESLDLYIRPYILPEDRQISSEDLFIFSSHSEYGHTSPLEQSDSGNAVERVFGDTAAVVPVWQFRQLLGGASGVVNSVSQEKHLVLVGNPAVYIPGRITDDVERSILRSVLETLKERYSLQKQRIEFTIQRIPSTLLGKEIARVEMLDFRERSGRLRLLCTGLQDGREVSSVVEGTVTIYKAYPTAARDIREGELFFTTDALLRAEPEGAVPSTVELSHEGAYIAERPIKRGEILTSWNTRPKKLVQSGEKVLVIVQQGNVQMKIPGVSRGSGLRGDIIPVRLSNGSIRDCSIQFEGEVRIEN